MMQFLRKAIFYIFAGAYLILCPVLILYAMGILFRPGTAQGIVKTGLIYLATAPSGADVYLGKSRYAQQTPATIRDLLPGEYSITLEMEGYKPWRRTVPVKEEKAVVFDRILLLPREWASREEVHGAFRDMIPLPDSGYLFLISGDTAGDISVSRHEEDKAWPLLEEGSPYRSDKLVSYFSRKGSSVVLLRLESGKKDRFLWVGLKEEDNEVKDISDLFPETPADVAWTADQPEQLFVFRSGQLDRIDVDREALYPRYVRNIKGFGLSKDGLYILRNDNVLINMDHDKKNSRILLGDKALGASVFGKEGCFRIKALPQETLLFLGENGELLANRLPYRFVDKGLRGSAFCRRLDHLLVWQKNRIGVLDLSAEETGAVGFEKGPALTWVYDGGRDIRQVFWVYEGSHVLFRDGKSILLGERGPDGSLSTSEICMTAEDSAVYYSERTGRVYFLAGAPGDLFSAEIVPQQSLLSEPSPEIKMRRGGARAGRKR